MKTLYLVRHAKSSWLNPNLTDIERPLLEKGKKRTIKIVEYFIKNDICPDLMISSHAVRARDTAEIIAHALNYDKKKILIDRSLYNADIEIVQKIFFDLPSNANSLMIVGHNPTMTDFSNLFIDEKLEWLPTSAVMALRFDTLNWLNVLNTKPEMVFYIYPSILKSINNEKDESLSTEL